MGCKTSKEIPHDCYETCLGDKKQISQNLKCMWWPSKPYWEYTIDHQNALQSISKEIAQDIIQIIESYIKDLCVNKRNYNYYKRCRSNIYHGCDISSEYRLKVCNEYYKQFQHPASNSNKRLKIVLLGQGAVGKTSLCDRAVGYGFSRDYDPVIEDFYEKQLKINQHDTNQVTFELLDTFGQEEFRSMRDYWIRDSDVIWFCFDVMRRETFQYVIDDFKRFADSASLAAIFPAEKAVIFVGCKVDLKVDNSDSYEWGCDEIYAWEIERGIAEIGDYPYVETSAKVGEPDGTNIHYLMRMSLYESWIQTKILQREDQQ